MIELEKFKPKKTKYKRIFKKHDISIATVANYLNLSYPYVCNILNGLYRMTPTMEKKLQKLADQLGESENSKIDLKRIKDRLFWRIGRDKDENSN